MQKQNYIYKGKEYISPATIFLILFFFLALFLIVFLYSGVNTVKAQVKGFSLSESLISSSTLINPKQESPAPRSILYIDEAYRSVLLDNIQKNICNVREKYYSLLFDSCINISFQNMNYLVNQSSLESEIVKDIPKDSFVLLNGGERRSDVVIVFANISSYLVKESIPFLTTVINDETNTDPSRNPIITEGVLGYDMYKMYSIDLGDGVIVEAKGNLIESVSPVNEVRYSTYLKPTDYYSKKTVVDGKEITYCGTLRVFATYYDKNCYGCSGITAVGAILKKGVVAVDPRYIPMYTNMYIPGYGYGTALDTGGAVKGYHIDLGFEDYSSDPTGWRTGYTDIYIMCD